VAAAELLAQARHADAEPDIVVLPSASGGTQAGLLAGLRAGGSGSRVIGVMAARPGAELRPAIAATLSALGEAMSLVIDPDQIETDDSQLGGGYGVRSRAADDATSLLARREGLFVDPIYTAKALAALIDRVRSRDWDGKRVVFWHAGGLPGLFEPLDG
jgi:1-aminocyclopropane-1-carboxylate deaminase/D-cysteine desulfhydrase-like pyridoxal-dependent ACC family enzyme